jgi:acyl-coenzyme A thioesterase PaaI-like protein
VEDETQPEQASPAVQERIRTSFDRQGLMGHLGARLGHIGPGRVHILLPSRPEVTQQHGYFHAGATSAIADSAGGYAAFTLYPENTSVLTVEYRSTSSRPPKANTSKPSDRSSNPDER